jgi:hypothetical protein
MADTPTLEREVLRILVEAYARGTVAEAFSLDTALLLIDVSAFGRTLGQIRDLPEVTQ